MSSPVTLTVGKETRLSMNVALSSDFDYTISGRLLCDGVGVAGKQIAIKVNGTVLGAVTTVSDGSYSATLHLPAANNQPTNYQIEAVFYGDNALNLTGLATLPNGTQYAVCTTLQYFSYKPAANATWLTVTPQSTQITQQPKTPEQMQAEAEQSGWLTVWHEFSWWYPWYRLHVRVLENGLMMFDIGMSVLPFGDIFDYVEEFLQRMSYLFWKIIWPVTSGIIIAESLSIIAASVSAGLDIALLLLASWLAKSAAILSTWNSAETLGSVFLGIFIPTIITAAGKGWDMFMTLLQLLEGVKSLAEIGFGRVYRLISFIANMVLLPLLLQRLDELGAW